MSEELEEKPEYGYIVGSGDARQELRWRFIVTDDVEKALEAMRSALI